ncbi:MAG: HAD hydrolase family protein, partial [Bacteroidales bacterium]|nr:HAD hydrolase family protein [Bacteroidales bacterium]
MKVTCNSDLSGPKRLLCFDLDGTLSQHKSHLPEETKDLLHRLREKYKLLMVGAGNAPRIYTQMEQFPVDIIANYGMQEARMVDGELQIVRQDTVMPDKEYFNRT